MRSQSSPLLYTDDPKLWWTTRIATWFTFPESTHYSSNVFEFYVTMEKQPRGATYRSNKKRIIWNNNFCVLPFYVLQQESGGTVLSTNWEDIAKEKTEIKPPDGMEYKKYEIWTRNDNVYWKSIGVLKLDPLV